MKHFPLSALPGTTLFVGVWLLFALPGCGRHTASHPASALSEKDRTTLVKYENIRAALVIDDLRTAKRAAADLAKVLNPTDSDPSTPLSSTVQAIADARDLNAARTAFSTLSNDLIPLVDGIQGFYIMDSPVPAGAEWVQTTAKVDNPYVGKPMRDVGSPRK